MAKTKDMRRWLLITVGVLIAVIIPQLLVESQFYARIISVASVCLLLWLTEATPPFVPSLVLWALVPLALGTLDERMRLPTVLVWAADPVLALFFGGFALGVAAKRYGLDQDMIEYALVISGDSYKKLLLFVILITAFLSMWLSNIAAAALMLACLRPAFNSLDESDLLRRVLLVGVALGADLGGMATPIGTGPNAVAIASLADTGPITFIGWMLFAFPLTIGMLFFSYFLLVWRIGGTDVQMATNIKFETTRRDRVDDPAFARGRSVLLGIMAGTICLWLSEPLHGISAAIISICASALLFLTRILDKDSLKRIDWSTLILISGGITLGKLFETSGIILAFSRSVPFEAFDPTFGLFLVCMFTAVLASLMSNTASVIMLIPLATALIPSPSTAILVAISASFGIPFIISTPPNAMAFGEGGVRSSDLFWPGIIIMLLGCLIISTTGPAVLKLAGIA